MATAYRSHSVKTKKVENPLHFQQKQYVVPALPYSAKLAKSWLAYILQACLHEAAKLLCTLPQAAGLNRKQRLRLMSTHQPVIKLN